MMMMTMMMMAAKGTQRKKISGIMKKKQCEKFWPIPIGCRDME